jgi:alpha,alpha-trehalase
MRTQIYCDASVGSLLSVVQSSHLFPDCKHFVDMPLRFDAATTLAAWKQLVAQTGGVISTDVLLPFINEHFEEPGCELEEHHPEDFDANQSFDNIADPHYRAFARELHQRWPTLSRRVTEKVKSNPENYSLLDLPHPFIVPGGRFRELYYWDSFWTIKGLITSGMFKTARGMIENMASLIDRYGFIPNGNRIYYLNRSQPPLLTFCVDAYYAATQDLEFVANIMPLLEKEMDFFTNNRLINQDGWKSRLFQFRVLATGPRPESFREDVESAEHIECILEKQRLWGDIAAAAESGRDFSIRWFGNEGPAANKMGSMRTSCLVPVELNSILCGNLRIFSQFYTLLGQHEKAAVIYGQFLLMREAIKQVFWNEEQGCWFDFDLAKNKQVEVFFDTNLFPMLCECAHPDLDGAKVVNYLNVNGILNYSGGIPTSLIASAQQWDFPAGWAPMNWSIIIGLQNIGQKEVAKTLASKWISRNYMIFKDSGKMYEKYNVASECIKSKIELGEYEIQEGFGWTNSVCLDLLRTFAGELTFDTQASANMKCECCRPQPLPSQDTIFSAPQDTTCPMPSETIETPSTTSAILEVAAVIAAEIAVQQAEIAAEMAQNAPEACINDGLSLIRAA